LDFDFNHELTNSSYLHLSADSSIFNIPSTRCFARYEIILSAQGGPFFQMKKIVISAALGVVAASVLCVGASVNKLNAADRDDHNRFRFKPDTLVLSRSVYAGTAATVTVGQTLPPGCVA